MHSLVFQGESFSIPMIPLFSTCTIFQTAPTLLARPYGVQSRVSVDSFRNFVDAINGAEPDITDDNAMDLALLSDEFQFQGLSAALATWRRAHPSPEAETTLTTASLGEQLQLHDRALCLFERTVPGLHQAAIESGRVKGTKAAKGTDFEAEQRRSLELGICALEGEIGGLRDAIAASGTKLKEDMVTIERQVADNLRQCQPLEDVRNDVAGLATQLKDVAAQNARHLLAGEEMQRTHQQLRAEVAGLRQRVEVLEQENQRLSEAMKAGTREGLGSSPIAKKDLTNQERELEKLKEGIRRMSLRKQFHPFLKKGVQFDVPEGIIAYLTSECGGNVHDHHVVEVTSGSFEKEISGANPDSGSYMNDPQWAAKNAADLETVSSFQSAYRTHKEDVPHTPNNWVCYHFKENVIVPTHYAIRSNIADPGPHLKSWLVETSVDGLSWREVAREEDSVRLKKNLAIGVFDVARGEECCFIRLVNIGRNHGRNSCLDISAWEIFGLLS
jgi:hypothetical protein